MIRDESSLLGAISENPRNGIPSLCASVSFLEASLPIKCLQLLRADDIVRKECGLGGSLTRISATKSSGSWSSVVYVHLVKLVRLHK